MASAAEPFETRAFRITSIKKKLSKRLISNLLERNFPNVASVTQKADELVVFIATRGSREDLHLFEQTLIGTFTLDESSVASYELQVVAPADRRALKSALRKHVIDSTPANLSSKVDSPGMPCIIDVHPLSSVPGGLPFDSATGSQPLSSACSSETEQSEHYKPGGAAWPESVCVRIQVLCTAIPLSKL